MTTVEKVKETLARERTRRDEFYKGAAYALKLVEAAQVCEAEQASTEAKPRTNGDAIRAMTDEELANVLCGCGTCAFRTDFSDCDVLPFCDGGLRPCRYRKPGRYNGNCVQERRSDCATVYVRRSIREKTCFWLKGLAPLKPTNVCEPPARKQYASGATMAEWYADLYRLPKNERSKERSRTFPGIAKAMAEQWGGLDEICTDQHSPEVV